jgi:hypothetical protein
MRKTALAALATGALALGIHVPPASAAGTSDFAGGCFVVSGLGGQAQLVGAVVTYSGVVFDNPVVADVTCSIVVNGATTSTVSFVAAPVGLTVGGIAYAAAPGSNVEVCTTVDYTSNNDYTDSRCVPLVDATPDGLLDTVEDLTQAADPTLCPILASESPGVPGIVDIDPTGDTYLLGDFFWDCPPYAEV